MKQTERIVHLRSQHQKIRSLSHQSLTLTATLLAITGEADNDGGCVRDERLFLAEEALGSVLKDRKNYVCSELLAVYSASMSSCFLLNSSFTSALLLWSSAVKSESCSPTI